MYAEGVGRGSEMERGHVKSLQGADTDEDEADLQERWEKHGSEHGKGSKIHV